MARLMRPLYGVAAACLLLAACAPPVAPPGPTVTPRTAAQPTAQPPSPAQVPTPTAVASITGRPLVLAALASLSKTLHPYPDVSSYSQSWIDIAALIWGGADGGGALLAFDWDTLAYRPAMATDLPRVSPDGKTFTFTVRDNLKWSDGSSVTVDDFTFAYDQVSRDDSQYVQLEIVQDIATFRALDQRTLEVTLKEAKPRDVALSVANVIVPVPRRVWEGRSWTDATANPEILNPSVVLGPFRVQDFRVERAVFEAVGTYYVGKPRVPRVEILANQPPAAAYEALKSGRANWIRDLPPALYQDARANPALDVKEWAPANATYRSLEFNVTRPFLSDKKVREALACAVNRMDLIEVADQGLGIPQHSFIQPTNAKWVNPHVLRYDFDMPRARQLLHEAGYEVRDGRLVGKDGQPIKLQVLYPSSSGPRGKIATYLQQRYGELGIEVEVKGLDFNAYTDQVQGRRDFDISLASYGGGALDPDLGPKAQLIQSGQQNVTGYANPQVDDLFRQASVELDDARRKQLYDQIQSMVNADLPAHYLYALKATDAFSREVRGVTPRKGSRLDYNDALLGWYVAD